jgi:hypothetical protein
LKQASPTRRIGGAGAARSIGPAKAAQSRDFARAAKSSVTAKVADSRVGLAGSERSEREPPIAASPKDRADAIQRHNPSASHDARRRSSIAQPERSSCEAGETKGCLFVAEGC